VPIDLYAQLTELGHRRQVNVVVDSSGPPLAASLPAGPDLIKPNEHELAELVGGELDTLGDVIDAAEEIRRRGVKAVLASLGADGVILLDAAGALYAEAPVTRVVSTVGAGDALLAGYLSTGSTREHRRPPPCNGRPPPSSTKARCSLRWMPRSTSPSTNR
jgi:1-phosphofructokinase